MSDVHNMVKTDPNQYPSPSTNAEPASQDQAFSEFYNDPWTFGRLYQIALVHVSSGCVLALGPKVSLVESELMSRDDYRPEDFGLAIKVLPVGVEMPGHRWSTEHGTWFEVPEET